MEKFINRLFRRSQNAHSTQYALFRLAQTWKSELNIFMDLSKAYDCLPHCLLVRKLEPYGADGKGLSLILHYLTNPKQHTEKIPLLMIGMT